MIRRPPRSTLSSSSAASDVYKRQKEALRSIGLLADDAQRDITEMRSLLEAWRDTRKSIWSTIVKLFTVGVLTFIAGAVWMTMGK